MKRMAAVFMMLCGAATVFAVTPGRVTEISGLGAMRLPGGDTITLERGDLVPLDATLATGFASSLRVSFPDWSLELSPMSRVVIREAAPTVSPEPQTGTGGDAAPSAPATEVALPFGRVRALVNPSDTGRVNFRVISPVSTASVRGTEFSYDGVVLRVIEGDVAIANALGQTHSVRAGQVSRAVGTDPITSVETTLRERALLD